VTSPGRTSGVRDTSSTNVAYVRPGPGDGRVAGRFHVVRSDFTPSQWEALRLPRPITPRRRSHDPEDIHPKQPAARRRRARARDGRDRRSQPLSARAACAVEKRDARVVDSLSRLVWADSTSITVDVGGCDCLEPTCDEGTFMVGCGGEVVELYGGFLNTVRRTSRATCLVCGCAMTTAIELRATPVCAGL